MSLEYAILGFLNEQDLTGYDLKTKHFDLCVSHFWNADQGQIYKTLDKLVEKELVSFKLLYQDNKPNKKVYSITNEGRNKLLLWLEEDCENSSIREAFPIKIFFAQNISTEKVVRLFENKKIKHKAKLDIYLEMKHNYFSNENMSKKELFESLTLDLGIKYETYWFEWCQESIDKIKNLQE